MLRTTWLILLVLLLVGEAVAQKQRQEGEGRWANGEDGNRRKPQKRKQRGEGRWKEQEESGQQRAIGDRKELTDELQDQKEEEVGFQPSDDINNITEEQKDKNRRDNENKRKAPNMDKPLLNLIFLLVGTLIIILFILLLKVYRRRQPDNPNPNFFPHANPPVQIIDPQTRINEQIKSHTICIQELQTIKSKYLMNLASNSNLGEREENSGDNQVGTPTFKHYTFRNI